MKQLDFSVVLPAFNEEKNVSLLYKEFVQVLNPLSKNFEIIFVDDGSTDRTYQELLQLRKKDPRVKVIRFRRNFGQTAALSVGFEHATGKIVISMDSDLQDDPHEIPRMLKKLAQGYDTVCAWRQRRSDKFSKRIFSLMAYLVRQFVVHDGIHDSGCQFRIYKNDCVKDLELYGELHRFIPALLKLKGYKVTEIKVKHRRRRFGKTKYNFTRIFKGLADVVTVRFWQQYAARPVHFFGAIGATTTALGVLAGIYLVYSKFFLGISIGNRPLLILCALLIIVGVQLFMMGLLADVIIKAYYRGSGKKPYSVAQKHGL